MPRPSRRWQYDQVVAPVSTDPGVPPVNVAEWAQPTSQPYFPRWYAQSTRSTINGTPEAVSVASWAQPTNQPRAPRFYTQAVNFDVAGSVTSVTIEKFPPVYDATVGRRSYAAALSASGAVFVPVTGTPEVITIDKWFQPASQPTRLPARDVALSQSIIDPKLLTQPESVSLDKFGPHLPDRLDRRFNQAYLVASGSYFVSPTVGEAITIDKFHPSYPDSIVRVPARPALGDIEIDSKLLTQPEQISIDKFAPHYPDWNARRFNSAYLVASGGVLVQFSFGENVTLDKWFHQQPDPIRRPAHFVDGQSVIDPKALTQPEAVSVDKWFHQQPDPPRIPTRAASGQFVIDPSILNQPESVTIDKFHPTYPDYITRIPARAALGTYAIDAKLLTQPEATSVDKWNPDYPSIIARASRQQNANQFTPFVSESITPDKWLPDYPVSVSGIREHPSRMPSYSAPVSTAKESVTIDRWQPDYPSLFAHTRSSQPDNNFVPVVERITEDKWAPDYPSQLARLTSHPSRLPSYFAPISTLKETVTIDRWQPNYPSILRRPETRIQTSGISPQFEAITADRWHPEYPSILRKAETRIQTQGILPLFESVTADRWKPEYPNYVAPSRRNHPAFMPSVFAPIAPTVAPIDSWQPQDLGPTYQPKRAAVLGESVIDPSILARPEATSVDKWQPRYPDSALPLRTVAHQEIVMPTGEVVTIDKWSPSYPSKLWNRAINPAVVPSTAAPVFIPPETITLDKWSAYYPSIVWTRGISPAVSPAFSVPNFVPPAFISTAVASGRAINQVNAEGFSVAQIMAASAVACETRACGDVKPEANLDDNSSDPDIIGSGSVR
jgi:hypothetical protein